MRTGRKIIPCEVWNGTVHDTVRPGRTCPCPKCGAIIRYALLNEYVDAGYRPFLYSDVTSDFLYRACDEAYIARWYDICKWPRDVLDLMEYYRDLVATIELCPSGGRFQFWSHCKCPSCGFEFTYSELNSVEDRLFPLRLVWMEGAIMYRGKDNAAVRLSRIDESGYQALA
jgi:hypothetical protein